MAVEKRTYEADIHGMTIHPRQAKKYDSSPQNAMQQSDDQNWEKQTGKIFSRDIIQRLIDWMKDP